LCSSGVRLGFCGGNCIGTEHGVRNRPLLAANLPSTYLLVALVRGVPMPLVLRNYGEEDRERYKIIGPAFVSGLMQGELRDQKLADIALV
jgi:hypothetical protein